MLQDEIVEEIHKIRQEYSRSFNHDLKAIFADLQQKQAESGREIVSLSRKRGLTRWSGRVRDIDGDVKDTSHKSTQKKILLSYFNLEGFRLIVFPLPIMKLAVVLKLAGVDVFFVIASS